MTDDFTSTRIDEQWIRIDCSDYETGDQFDDYLTEELDLEIATGRNGDGWSFFFDNGFTVEGIANLLADFKLWDEENFLRWRKEK